MAEEDFITNIARVIAATLYHCASLHTAREMYGKGYYELGVPEKAMVDQTTFASISANYQAVTPENLRKQTSAAPAGFQVQPPPTK